MCIRDRAEDHASPRFGVAYDKDDLSEAVVKVQASWRGHGIRRQLRAALSIQKMVRGKLGRKQLPLKRQESSERSQKVQEALARTHRLRRLEMERKMLESTDADSYFKFMVKRQNRAAIKVQKVWRMKVAARKILKQQKFSIEYTPELENAVLKLQRCLRHARSHWRPPAYPPEPSLRQALEYKIRQHMREPTRESSWENNHEWVQKEASKRFWEYRTKRGDQQQQVWSRKMLRKEMDTVIARIESTSDFDSLMTIPELEQRGLLRASYLNTGSTNAMHAFQSLQKQLGGNSPNRESQ
eukprot:TRINITY_DN3310_c0_g1_i5.p2 TRINITY_DN3310_c0_g1~~TRINITY_DN3310_c0_g1_i5.p2  ORF type:complete len:298 (+),score=102.94 TRINITY_DN3310_c0_g1_i5:104-997(+)